MKTKLTVMIDDQVLRNLKKRAGARRIGQFIEEQLRPVLMDEKIDESYRAMAADREEMKESQTWMEGAPGDVEPEEFHEKR